MVESTVLPKAARKQILRIFRQTCGEETQVVDVAMRHDSRNSQRGLDWEEALDDVKIIKLDGHLDYSVAEKIYGEFIAALGRPIAIDAGNVTFVGALAHQVLLSAKKTWDAADISFAVTAASKEFDGYLDMLGSPNGVLGPVQS